MPRLTSTPVPISKDDVRQRIDDCLRKKNMTRQDLARETGLRFPKPGHEPKALSAQTIANQLSKFSGPLTMDVLSKWCTVLEYPIEDLLAGNEYVDPQSLEALRREFQRAEKRIAELEEEVQKLKEINGQVTT